jgi:hypothetical protein
VVDVADGVGIVLGPPTGMFQVQLVGATVRLNPIGTSQVQRVGLTVRLYLGVGSDITYKSPA